MNSQQQQQQQQPAATDTGDTAATEEQGGEPSAENQEQNLRELFDFIVSAPTGLKPMKWKDRKLPSSFYNPRPRDSALRTRQAGQHSRDGSEDSSYASHMSPAHHFRSASEPVQRTMDSGWPVAVDGRSYVAK